MIELNKTELQAINGGGISAGLGFLIMGGIMFIIGIFDGYVRPFRCR